MDKNDEAKRPERIQISKAPPPIRPLEGKAMVATPPRAPLRANWGKWSHMHEVELWQAVALSLNFEPNIENLPIYFGAFDRFGDDPFRICPQAFRERLDVATSQSAHAFPLNLVHSLKARCIVTLPEFGDWAAGVWPDLPAEFPRGALARPTDASGSGSGSGATAEAADWSLKQPRRYQGYARPLFLLLKAVHTAGGDRPKPRDVLDAFKKDKPAEVVQVNHDGFIYLDSAGSSKEASLAAIGEAIRRMTS